MLGCTPDMQVNGRDRKSRGNTKQGTPLTQGRVKKDSKVSTTMGKNHQIRDEAEAGVQ